MQQSARIQTTATRRSVAERAAQHFGELVEGLGVVVWERDPASCEFTFVSRHAEEMLGYPLDRWLEPNFWTQLIHAEDRERVVHACRTAADTADQLDYEYRALRADGRVVWMREILHVVRDADGTARQLRGVLTDITERRRLLESERQARAEAEEQRRRAQFLAEASIVLSSSLDYEATLQSVARLAVPFLADWCAVDVLDEHRTLRRVAAAHVDASREDLLWRLRQRDPHPGSDTFGLGRMLRTGRAELVASVPQELLTQGARDGESLGLVRSLAPRSYIGIPLIVGKEVRGAVFLVTSESGREYAAADLQLAEELGRRLSQAVDNARLHMQVQQAVRVRDEFLAATSHELRTPLAHIKGFVSTLRQSDVEWDEATRQDFLAEIERESDRLTRLIGNLLDISRLESGALSIDGAPTPPRALLARGLERIRPLLADRSITIEAPETLPELTVDSVQMESVFANLFENAAKYTPVGSPLRLTAAEVDGGVELRVEDEGPGIPPADLDRIFDKFVRGSRRSGSTPGTGLGLAICHGIVKASAGRIWAENRPSGGAAFVVWLPLSRSETP
jgi:PAS domain S-box-containing protein